jgi:MFS family permease
METAPNGVRSARTATALAMFGVLLLSYVVNAMDRQVFPLILTDVRAEYHFSLADAGLLSTVFTLGMGLAGIPTGLMLARLGRRNVTIIGILLYSAATILTAAATGYWDMLAYRVASGLGEAMQLTALFAIAASYFTRYRAAAIGSVNLCFALGAIAGPSLGGMLLTQYNSWRVPLIAFGLLGGVVILLILAVVRPWLSESVPAPDGDSHAVGAGTLANHNTILLTLISVCGGLAIYAYLGMYPVFLREELGYSKTQTASVLSMYGLGALISIGGGWLGDRYSPRTVLGLGSTVAACVAALLFYGPTGVAAQATASLVWGAVISGIIYVNLAGYHVKAVQGTLTGKASGLFVATLYVPAAFSGYLVGWVAGKAGWGTVGSLLCLTTLVAAGASLALRPSAMAGRWNETPVPVAPVAVGG